MGALLLHDTQCTLRHRGCKTHKCDGAAGVGLRSTAGIGALASVTPLTLSDNAIRAIEELKSLTNLKHLDLDGTKLAKLPDLEPLLALKQLRSLDIGGCPIESLVPDCHNQVIKMLSVLPSFVTLNSADDYTNEPVEEAEGSDEEEEESEGGTEAEEEEEDEDDEGGSEDEGESGSGGEAGGDDDGDDEDDDEAGDDDEVIVEENNEDEEEEEEENDDELGTKALIGPDIADDEHEWKAGEEEDEDDDDFEEEEEDEDEDDEAPSPKRKRTDESAEDE